VPPNCKPRYFFHGGVAAVVSHDLVKEKKVPPREIDLAITRMKRFQTSPEQHSFRPTTP